MPATPAKRTALSLAASPGWLFANLNSTTDPDPMNATDWNTIRQSWLTFEQYPSSTPATSGFAYTVDRHLKAWIAPASDLGKDNIDWKPLFKKEDEVLWFEASDKDLYLYTSKKAPNFQLLKTSVEHPDPATAQVVIPENKNEILTGFALSSNGLYYTISINGVQATAYRLDEKSGKIIK